jgi:hypothetical protein
MSCAVFDSAGIRPTLHQGSIEKRPAMNIDSFKRLLDEHVMAARARLHGAEHHAESQRLRLLAVAAIGQIRRDVVDPIMAEIGRRLGCAPSVHDDRNGQRTVECERGPLRGAIVGIRVALQFAGDAIAATVEAKSWPLEGSRDKETTTLFSRSKYFLVENGDPAEVELWLQKYVAKALEECYVLADRRAPAL